MPNRPIISAPTEPNRAPNAGISTSPTVPEEREVPLGERPEGDPNDPDGISEVSQNTEPNEYRPARIDAVDVIVFAAMRMKYYYDRRYQQQTFQERDYINLRLYRGYKLPGVMNVKIN